MAHLPLLPHHGPGLLMEPKTLSERLLDYSKQLEAGIWLEGSGLSADLNDAAERLYLLEQYGKRSASRLARHQVDAMTDAERAELLELAMAAGLL